jgi:hypothetical protein
MIDLREWARMTRLPPKPWLVLGKGPTFSRRREFDLTDYNLLSLNHVVRELRVDIAHAIDVDVVLECADALRGNCRWLMMPRRPHVNFRPADRLLEDFVAEIPVLRELNEAGRLVWYNLSNSEPVGDAPVIGVRFFSAEAALNILAEIGATTVRSLGIDGGRGYSGAFADLERTTMLANTQTTFNIQFAEIDAIVKKHDLDYAPLVPSPQQEPMRVFVGCDESQLVASSVLEHSIRKHASRPVEFTKMIDLEVPEPKDTANRARTGFSFYRFLIPKLCGYQGRALYLDSDMQVFADMAELWEIPFEDDTVLCTYQSEPPERWKNDPNFKPGRHLAVMMLDCSRLHWDIDEIVLGLDEGRYDYKQLMSDLCIVPDEQIAERIPREWNSLEQYEPGKTKLVHYTVVPTQPWKNDENPLRDLWMKEYREAVGAGAIEPDLVRRSVEAGHVKPSLAHELDEGTGDGQAEIRPNRMRYALWRAGTRVRERLSSVSRYAPGKARGR